MGRPVPFSRLPRLSTLPPLDEDVIPHSHTLEVLEHWLLLRSMLTVLRSHLPPPLTANDNTASTL